MTACRTDRELLAWVAGECTVNEADRFRAHIAECRACSEIAERSRQLLEAIARPPEGLEHSTSFIDRVERAIALEDGQRDVGSAPKVRGWRWGLLAAAALLAGLLVIPSVDRSQRGTWTARGAKSETAEVGAEILVIDAHGAAPVDTRVVRASDSLGVRYWNRTNAVRYLMAFGIDAAGEIHWVYPAYESESADPASIPIAPAAARVLGEVVQPERPVAGPFRLVTLISTTPVQVKHVETALQNGKRSVAEAFPTAVVTERLVRWEIARP